MGARPGVGGAGRRLTVLAFLSGAGALAYEVLYVRHLTPVLGDALHVHAALLATFLLGLAAGSAVADRWHRWLAPLEVAVGAWALLLPLLTGALAQGPLLARVAGSPVATALTVAALVAPAALLLGVALPLFSAYVKEARSREGLAFQDVYAVYNLGAVAGVLAVELVGVRLLGVRGSLALVGATHLAIGAVVWRTAGTRVTRPAVEGHRFPAAVVTAVVLVGLAGAVTQLFLLRSLDLVLEPHRGNFALGLAVILGGMAAGSWLVARTRLTFAGALVLLPLPLLGAYAVAVSPGGLLWNAPVSWGPVPSLVLLTRLAVAALLGFLPMALFGATLPALMRDERAVAREAGSLLAWSGVANAAGYFLYVGWLAPHLSGGAVLACVTLAVVGAAALAGGAASPALRRVAVVGVVAAGALAWRWSDADFHLATRRDQLLPGDTVEIFRWGGESATLVSSRDARWISYNGHPGIRTQEGGVVNTAELLSGVLPALVAPARERAVVLGLGTGITAGAAARMFDAVDAVEINGAFLDMAPRLREESLGLTDLPSARLHLADGRTFLAGKDGAYDAVINSVPAPTVYSAGKIYTEDFYRAALRSLRPGGVYATWLSTGDMTRRGVETVLATLSRVFPHCALFALRADYFLATCSSRPLAVRPFVPGDEDALLVRRLAEGVGEAALGEYVDDVFLSTDVFAWGGPGGVTPNTDDRPVLEFLVLGARTGAAEENAIVAEPERYGVTLLRPGEAPTPDRLARRGRVWARVVPDLFERFFPPLLGRDPALEEAWIRSGGESPSR